MSLSRAPLAVPLIALFACGTPPAEGPTPAPGPRVTVFRTATCQCCSRWEDHLRREGFTVESKITRDLRTVRSELGIADDLASCHTGWVEGYAVEGHVPAQAVRSLLAERPDARGLAVPGMPVGSPGMEDPRHPGAPFDVLLIEADGTVVPFLRYTP